MTRFDGLAPASPRSSRAARGASRKRDTTCELALRRHLTLLGLRYRLAPKDLPGKPDIVFRGPHVAVFCDGDFWHGRAIEERIKRLAAGHNAPYWVAKIRGNVERDRRFTEQLEAEGWLVIRLWETDILRDPVAAAEVVRRAVAHRR
ncbi:MAG: very short patch repair endonuclease [Myxococcales bacterium]|nr:very short patch repair endonuclease [Myxococcales bacterium]MCA9639298.1 very short patch repair endonuclease [Myxococcales bacterium]